jgi:hypothetical protein
MGDLYRDAWLDLDHDRIRSFATDVRKMLDLGHAVDLDLTPGDMTRYPMTLTPLWNVIEVGGNYQRAWPGLDYATGVVVAIGGGFGSCYAINLLGRHERDYIHHSYVAEHWLDGKDNASAVAIALFLEAVAGVKSFDPTAAEPVGA